MKRLLTLLLVLLSLSASAGKRTVYMTYILHGNMNYDRYTRPTIWKEFPVIYDNLLTFMDEHPDFKGQLQFSGQTFGSLQQAAPEVIDHAKEIHSRGQLNFTGTFYSEPVNVNMDGETNFRCAWLGTRIIEDNVGRTDGFYLQERAYHPQLPWILNNAGVSWTPIIMNGDCHAPFRLRGLDGSTSVCVPITRGDFIPKVENAPKNALIAIEEDYEIPQTFAKAYARAEEFNRNHKDVRIEWITVKEYIQRFGLGKEMFVDHSEKIDDPEKGAYSRWTVDPLDIVVQDATNGAMNLFRIANALDALLCKTGAACPDVPFEGSGIALKHDPLVWNVERADLYPDHEKYLQRGGVTTVLSKSEHLLLWAVNSDAKGWFPLYERRRERLNALENSGNLSRYVINRAMDALSAGVKTDGYVSCYMVLNLEAARRATVVLEETMPCEVYDLASGCLLRSSSVCDGASCRTEVEVDLPSYGYCAIGTRPASADLMHWREGCSVSSGGICVEAEGDRVVLHTPTRNIDIGMEPFMIKALAHMDKGEGDGQWRQSKEYGSPRVSVCTDGLYPVLRVERQIDYLVHMQQKFTILPDRVDCDVDFVMPHPCVIRREGNELKKTDFKPSGLDMTVETHTPGSFGFDIPFGISLMPRRARSYFCPLTSCFLNFEDGGGLLVAPSTGEQAFSLRGDDGALTLYLGTSTTSGPIREVGLAMPDPTTVKHKSEWYAEPFHGSYHHHVSIMPFEGGWNDAHVPASMRAVAQPVIVRRINRDAKARSSEDGPYSANLIDGVPENVDVTGVFCTDGQIRLRLNEREGRSTRYEITVAGEIRRGAIGPFAIQTL